MKDESSPNWKPALLKDLKNKMEKDYILKKNC